MLKSEIGYLHNPLDVTMAFSEVNMPESSSTFPVLDVGFEHGARTFSLSPDHTSHRVLEQTTVSVIYRLDIRMPTLQPLANSDTCLHINLVL